MEKEIKIGFGNCSKCGALNNQCKCILEINYNGGKNGT